MDWPHFVSAKCLRENLSNSVKTSMLIQRGFSILQRKS